MISEMLGIHSDYVIIGLAVITFVLLLIGLIMLLSASTPSSLAENGDSYSIFRKQFWFAIGGAFLATVISFFNFEFLVKSKFIQKLLYVGSFLLTLSVLVLGVSSGGANRWIEIPGFGSFQPSEFVKIIFVFFVASMLYKGTDLKRVFLTSCFTLVRIPAWIIDGKGQYLCMAVMAMLCNLLLGMFAYRFGDALLYLMTQFCILIWCAPNVWCAAMIVGLASAMVYFLVLYGRAFIEKKGNRKSRFPFTLCLFLGSLTTFFLFL